MSRLYKWSGLMSPTSSQGFIRGLLTLELQRQSRPIVGELSVLQSRMYGGSIQNGEEDSREEPLDLPDCETNECLVKKFLQDKQLAGGVAADDLIIQQFSQFVSLEFLFFKPMEKRLDMFLHRFISERYPELWAFLQKLLLLSHGQAAVERRVSINKEVEICNIQEDTVIEHRIIYDYVWLHGVVIKVPLTPELLSSVTAARTRYGINLENERRKNEYEAKSLPESV
ncbi:uncharacterized protein LOC119883194 [Micropterus salmoides]|uniref:uncharacterized protein LOC119883194 n=1 Tax=Micropterus salmoides TaxID=27706 RepID=UPI0018EAC99C|nr:uncharacterized protein LOC119883194 [Micropterus salmoides]